MSLGIIDIPVAFLPKDYHPEAACLLYKATNDAHKVYELLDQVIGHGFQMALKQSISTDETKLRAERYEKIRLLNPQQFKDLYMRNIESGVHFDILVDQLKKR